MSVARRYLKSLQQDGRQMPVGNDAVQFRLSERSDAQPAGGLLSWISAGSRIDQMMEITISRRRRA
jgi:hypothetical protein